MVTSVPGPFSFRVSATDRSRVGGPGAGGGVCVCVRAVFVSEKAQRLCDRRRRVGEGKGEGERSVYGVGKSGEEERSHLGRTVAVSPRDTTVEKGEEC